MRKSANTVKKHAAKLIAKMGMDTRLMAALQAAEVLELKMVDPDKLTAVREKYAR